MGRAEQKKQPNGDESVRGAQEAGRANSARPDDLGRTAPTTRRTGLSLEIGTGITDFTTGITDVGTRITDIGTGTIYIGTGYIHWCWPWIH